MGSPDPVASDWIRRIPCVRPDHSKTFNWMSL
jgi:hypothetical protein